MNVEDQIEAYITSLPEPKRSEMQTLHQFILDTMPAAEWWFLDGKDETGKIVSNPNIGYGHLTITYAEGKTKPFYQIGISSNTGGISVYIMGIEDKQYLVRTFGDKIGKAAVSGYCMKFKKLRDINLEVLEEAIRDAIGHTSTNKS